MTKTVITAAHTGVPATRDQSPAIPYQPKDTGGKAARASDQGQALVHIPTRPTVRGP